MRKPCHAQSCCYNIIQFQCTVGLSHKFCLAAEIAKCLRGSKHDCRLYVLSEGLGREDKVPCQRTHLLPWGFKLETSCREGHDPLRSSMRGIWGQSGTYLILNGHQSSKSSMIISSSTTSWAWSSRASTLVVLRVSFCLVFCEDFTELWELGKSSSRLASSTSFSSSFLGHFLKDIQNTNT